MKYYRLLLWLVMPVFYLMMLAITSLKLWTVTEDYSLGDVVILLEPGAPVQQTINPRYPGLFRIDVHLGKVTPQINGLVYLIVTLAEKPEIEINRAHPPASTSQYVRDGVYPFVFSPAINSASQSHILSLVVTGGASMSTFGVSDDSYRGGRILMPLGSEAQDLSFKLYYRPGILYTLRTVGLWEAVAQLIGQNLYESVGGYQVTTFLVLTTALYLVAIYWLPTQLQDLS